MEEQSVLVAEDDPSLRPYVSLVLQHQGFLVLEACDGAEALPIFRQENVDLLVTDMSMPGMTGWDLAKSLRTARPGLPVLFISGHNDHETARWGTMAQPVEHLFKPFSLEAFLYKARQMLDRKKP